ncbi:MAG TPA: MYXO-CTERM sorting domain-containing protein, partial [Polyangia bacterium]|nr:MYXO-CTERM sorting domain-containing protein [Polyangia bacterium]
GRPITDTPDGGGAAGAGDAGPAAPTGTGPRGHAPGPAVDQGCACAVPGTDPPGAIALLLLLPGLAAVRRPRPRR